MNILVTNDDGIQSRGLKELVGALHNEAEADVYVAAPDGQRSAISHAISLAAPIEVREAEVECAEMAFAMTGTPADCVAVGIELFRELGIEIDMVFAGINHGGNLGTDTVYSGTVGAAMEGSIHGFPSVAVSVDAHHPENFEYACRLAAETVEKTGGRWNSSIMLNINTPDLPPESIKGTRYTVIGERDYTEDICFQGIEDGVRLYKYGGEVVFCEDGSEEHDVIAIQEGFASITPMHKDMTAIHAKADLENWRIGK